MENRRNSTIILMLNYQDFVEIFQIFHPKFLIFNIQEDAPFGPILNRFSRAVARWKAVCLYFVRKYKKYFCMKFFSHEKP